MERKVLIIVENASVPVDPRVWNEAKTLHDNGYAVTVLCPRSKEDWRGFEIHEGVRIYRHPMPPDGNGVAAYFWEYACALWWEFVYTWWIYFRHGFQAIQACNPPDILFLVAVLFKLLGVKFVFDHHDINPELYLAKYHRKDLLFHILTWLERLTFWFADVTIATNGSYREVAIKRGRIRPDRVFIVRNGPDPTKFKPVPQNPALKYGKRFLVGYVGTMGAQEGLDLLIDVAQEIKRKGHLDVHFTCVGGGPALRDLRQTVAEKGLEAVMNFTGRIPFDQLLEILSTADVCVNPDKPCEMNDKSTMIKIMEYMALGKPIVQFDLKEGRFSAGDASLYADNDNQIADFAAKVLWLLEHPDARRKMGAYGRNRIEGALAWEYSVNSLLAAYNVIFEKKEDRPPFEASDGSSSERIRSYTGAGRESR